MTSDAVLIDESALWGDGWRLRPVLGLARGLTPNLTLHENEAQEQYRGGCRDSGSHPVKSLDARARKIKG
jgi:hypothetical protein